MKLPHVPVSMGGCTAEDIVKGHRERTLALLWRIIMHFKIPLLIDAAALKKEVECILRSHRISHRTDLIDSVSDEKMFANNEGLQALLAWANAVCIGYGLRIRNFTSSFADGRAFCFLINFYYPMLLPLDRIRETTASIQRKQKEKVELLNRQHRPN